jgi:two-component system cell cycle response regulator
MMTLRGRLTTAFLAVVLGPVLLGAVFVGGTTATVSAHQSEERLKVAANTVRTSVSALCRQLHAAADAVAVAEPAGRAGTAAQVVARGLAGSVLVTGPGGQIESQTADQPRRPWADCAGPAPSDAPARALAVRVELRDAAGGQMGAVAAAQVLDTSFVARLAAATGTAVTLLDGNGGSGAITPSTENVGSREAVLAAAARITGDGIARTPGGRYVRRVGPSPGQPLPLVLSVARDEPAALYAVLIGAVLLAGLFAVLAAWRLARSTTRPLAELARAVERVAEGDLDVRVPVATYDEVGRLASTFNRMTRETQAYVQALTTSRDQLRGHLAVLGDTLASTHDLQRILRVILQSALTATGARAGLVLLVDPLSGALVGQCAEGLGEPAAGVPGPREPVTRLPGPGEPAIGAQRPGAPAADTDGPAGPATGGDGGPTGVDPTSLRIPLGSGLLGQVAATGEPRRGRTDRDGPPLASGEPHCETYVAVPFSAPSPTGDGLLNGTVPRMPFVLGVTAVPAALGVLALYDRLGSDEFDDADLVTLRTFAQHAAVAVDNVRVHEEAQRLSLTDPLTGLWNYRYLKESIRREVERASRFGRMLSVLALDLDRFKDVNDTYGHAAGDAVLAEFARRIRGVIREVDLAFRQGGEEFVVLLPETDARGAAIVAERLGAAIRNKPVVVAAAPGSATPPALIEMTVSIGIAVYPDHASTGQRVLDTADDALYAAKAAGKDTYRVATSATEGDRPPVGEIAVAAGAVPPDDGLPGAGGRPVDPSGGASSGPHPPRQSRGR